MYLSNKMYQEKSIQSMYVPFNNKIAQKIVDLRNKPGNF